MIKERLNLLAAENREQLQNGYDYYCLIAPGEWVVVNAIPLRKMLKESPEETRNSVMSLRLGTGIIGELDCPSGDSDYAPKGYNEVIIGLGEAGIEALLELGALPCISCHSGDKLAQTEPDLLKKSLGGDLEDTNNTDFLVKHYDARRLDWSKILPLGIAPKRFYTRPGLTPEEVSEISSKFETAGLPTPAIGYYDRTRKDRFFRYN